MPHPADVPLSPCPAAPGASADLAAQLHAQAQGLSTALASPAAAGLRQALLQAPVVVLCAVGTAYQAARLAQAPLCAVAQLLVWVLRPDELPALGAGLFRQAQLLVVSLDGHATDAERAACRQAILLGRSYHCPILLLEPDGTAAPAADEARWGAPWRLPTCTGPANTHAALALPYVGHLRLACALARWRAEAPGVVRPEHGQGAEALELALQAHSAAPEALAHGCAQVPRFGALRAACAQARSLRLRVAPSELMPAAQACVAGVQGITVAALADGLRPDADAAAGPGDGGCLTVTADAAALHLNLGGGPSLTLPLPVAHPALRGLYLHQALMQLCAAGRPSGGPR